MTQPAQQQTTVLQTLAIDGKELPFEFPRCSRVLSDPPLPPDNPKPGQEPPPLLWGHAEPHPMIEGHVIVRMYVMPGVGVEVYSVERPKDGVKGAVRGGVRVTIPWSRVRTAEEVMDLSTFCDEIITAEKGEGEGAEEPDAPGETPAAGAAANGSVAS
jgi:hypothetical protein